MKMAVSHFLNVVKQLGIDQELLCHMTRERLKQKIEFESLFLYNIIVQSTFCDMHYMYELLKYVAGFFELFIQK